jgi:hypothetical protein
VRDRVRGPVRASGSGDADVALVSCGQRHSPTRGGRQ